MKWIMAIHVFIYYSVLISLIGILICDQINESHHNDFMFSEQFKNRIKIKPRIHHRREKRQIYSNLQYNMLDNLIVEFKAQNETYTLDLRLNSDLIPKNYFHKYQSNGTFFTQKPKLSELNLCQYKGSIVNKSNSWAAISSCDQVNFSGAFYDGSHLFFVEKSDLISEHFLYKDSDFIPNDNLKICDFVSNNQFHRLKKRSADTIKGPYRVNEKSRFIELLLVIDTSEFRELKSLKNSYQKAKNIANILNALFSELNIFVALTGVVVWTEKDEIEISKNGDVTLNNFLAYRQRKLNIQHPNDNAQLITKVVFENGVVGKALKGPICTSNSSGGIAMDHSNVIGLVATTIAHELGHNFGMEHDTSQCKCVDKTGCIMAPSSTSIIPKHWSSCSLDYLALAFTHGMDYCLRNKPESLFQSPTCGNGFVEADEECDCGLPEFCNNTCCNAATCKFNSNVTCATGDCCNLDTCDYKTGGTECRKSLGECDLPEYCTGDNEYCPDDVFKMNSEICSNGEAFCFDGNCKSRSDQCKILWGETGRRTSDECYYLNKEGDRNGNCGYNHYTKVYKKCEKKDVFCGMLHCHHLNEKLEFGLESSAILSKSFINSGGHIIACRNALVDLGLNSIDPGLVPNGAKCGNNDMCYNQKCWPVDDLRNNTFKMCIDCGPNGVCNSKGNCHCNEGFAPPDCNYPGYGGSVDSGPMDDPKGRNMFMFLIYILFFGVFPTFGLLGFLSYYTQFNFGLKLKKPKFMTGRILKPRPSNNFNNRNQHSQQLPLESDNSTLLQPENKIGFPNQFFGHFKGFSITPLQQKEISSSSVTPSITIKSQPVVPPMPRFPTTLKQHFNVFENANLSQNSSDSNDADHIQANGSIAGVLGVDKRPKISKPILQTATHKDVIDLVVSNSGNKRVGVVPVRPAPSAPSVKSLESITKDLEFHKTAVINEPSNDQSRKKALNRIVSFIRSPNQQTQSKAVNTTTKKPSISLKDIEISKPIPLNEIQIAKNATPVHGVNESDNKPTLLRVQSYRNSSAGRSNNNNGQKFGSLQRSHSKRPVSAQYSAHRPKNPPPPKPLENDDHNDQTADNIYAVIDDIQPEVISQESNTSLMGEILTEIQNRNSDSIYSVSTLMRKKSKGQAINQNEILYANSDAITSDFNNIYANLTDPDVVASCQSGSSKDVVSEKRIGSRMSNTVQELQKKFERS